jgi:Flp pilus assembly protein TadD
MINSRWAPAAFLVAAVVGLQGCTNPGSFGYPAFGDTVSGLDNQVAVEYYADDQVLAQAKNLFTEGNYGRAQQFYQRAVELTPNDAEAWLGLAASYDRVRRFDLADRAYRQAAALIGNRPEFYNNLGYSFLLRGDLVKARDYFLKAYELDPANPTIANNLELLRDSVSSPQRG